MNYTLWQFLWSVFFFGLCPVVVFVVAVYMLMFGPRTAEASKEK